jgi:hypothetical protein
MRDVGSTVTQDEAISSDWTKLMELTFDVLLAGNYKYQSLRNDAV